MNINMTIDNATAKAVADFCRRVSFYDVIHLLDNNEQTYQTIAFLTELGTKIAQQANKETV